MYLLDLQNLYRCLYKFQCPPIRDNTFILIHIKSEPGQCYDCYGYIILLKHTSMPKRTGKHISGIFAHIFLILKHHSPVTLSCTHIQNRVKLTFEYRTVSFLFCNGFDVVSYALIQNLVPCGYFDIRNLFSITWIRISILNFYFY